MSAATETPARLTDAEAAAIAGRWAKATPGPWNLTTPRAEVAGFEMGRLLWDGNDCCFGEISDNEAENADAIAAARSDVAALLADRAALVAEVERLRARLTPTFYAHADDDSGSSFASIVDAMTDPPSGEVCEIDGYRKLVTVYAVRLDVEDDPDGRLVTCETREEAARIAEANAPNAARGAA